MKKILFVIALISGDVISPIDKSKIAEFLKRCTVGSKTTYSYPDALTQVEIYETTPGKGRQKTLLKNIDSLNKDGQPTKRQTSHWDGLKYQLESTHLFTYDKTGNEILESFTRQVNRNGDYGEVGRLYKSEKSYNSENKIISEKFWSTSEDDVGKYSKDGYYLKSSKTFEYIKDSTGRYSKIKSFLINPRTLRKIWWQTQNLQYVADNRQPSEVVLESDPYSLHLTRKDFIPPKTVEQFTYDASGNKESEIILNEGKFSSQEFLVYDQHKIKYRAGSYKKDEINHVETYTYDQNGKLLEITKCNKP